MSTFEIPLTGVDQLVHRVAADLDSLGGSGGFITPGPQQLLLLYCVDMVGQPLLEQCGIQLHDPTSGTRFFYFNSTTSLDDQYLTWRGLQVFGPGIGPAAQVINGTWSVRASGVLVPYYP